MQLSNRYAVSEPLSARPASVLRTLANPSNRCAVSEPVSATPASVLRTLANPSLTREGLLKSIRAAAAPLLFDFLSSFLSQKAALKGGFFLLICSQRLAVFFGRFVLFVCFVFFRLVIEEVFKILIIEIVVVTFCRACFSESLRNLSCAARYSFGKL